MERVNCFLLSGYRSLIMAVCLLMPPLVVNAAAEETQPGANNQAKQQEKAKQPDTAVQEPAMAQPDTATQKSVKARWQCKWCPYNNPELQKSRRGMAQVGAGVVSDDSAKYGSYTGLDEEGGYGVAHVSAEQNMGNGYINVRGGNLGLDSRSLNLSSGLPGLFELELDYDQLPTLYQDSGATPYSGSTNTG